MNALEYYRHLKDFTTKHGISRDPLSRLEKANEELIELNDAIAGGEHNEIMNEAADLLNVCADIILILGGNPLWRAYQKLEEAAARPVYREISARIAKQRSEQ